VFTGSDGVATVSLSLLMLLDMPLVGNNTQDPVELFVPVLTLSFGVPAESDIVGKANRDTGLTATEQDEGEKVSVSDAAVEVSQGLDPDIASPETVACP